MKHTLFFQFLLAVIAAVFVASAADADYFPPVDGDWERISPADAGWDAGKVQEALDCAGESDSSGVVILLKGKILAEKYWELPEDRQSIRYVSMIHGKTAEGHVIEDVASAQKSVTSYLAGVAQAKGLLNFEEPVSKYLGEGWSKAEKKDEAKITVRHLLSMSSGLDAKLEFQAEAGKKWLYNTTAYSQLHPVLEKATGKDMNTITSEWITAPIGMTNSRWVKRPFAREGVSANAVGFATTPRDLARFGLLVIQDGLWNGKDLLNNPQYLKTAFSPSQDMNKAYGFLWWLNGQPLTRGGKMQKSLIPAAPKDLFAAQGALGRKLYIVPSLDLVISRLGANAKKDFPDKFWTLLMEAVSPVRTPVTE